MGQAHYVGGPSHKQIVEYGPEGFEIAPGYNLYSETHELPQLAYSDGNIVILVHDSIHGYGMNHEKAMYAVKDYWQQFVEGE